MIAVRKCQKCGSIVMGTIIRDNFTAHCHKCYSVVTNFHTYSSKKIEKDDTIILLPDIRGPGFEE